MTQLCATCALAMKKLCEPMTVSASGFGRAMHRDMFAEDVVVANAQARRLVFVFQILRRVADDATGVKPVARANRRQPGKINMRPDDAVRAQLHAFVNHGIRPDPDRGVQFGLRMNDGGWMNHRYT